MRQLQVDFTAIDYAKTALDEAAIKSIVDAAGGVAAVLNARHATAKANGWADAPPSAAVFAKAAAAEPNLLKRPIVIAGNQAIVGFSKTAYAALPKAK